MNLKILENVVKTPPDRCKYVFLADDDFYATNLIGDSYITIIITETDIEPLIDCLTRQRFNGHSKEYMYLPICSARTNKALQAALKREMYKYSSEVWKYFSGKIDGFRADEQLLWETAGKFIKGLEKLTPVTRQTDIVYINPLSTPESRQRYSWDDIGCGHLFADTFKDVCRYVPESKSWFYYDGKIWRKDLGNLFVAERAKELSNYLWMLYATGDFADESAREKYQKFARQRVQRKFRDTMIRDAESVYPISINNFDVDGFLLNCQNGTLDLRTMTLNPHRGSDLISQIANVEYEPTAKCERWESFTKEIFCGDMALVKFYQKVFGYGLTGDTSQECLFIGYGATTRNGKGTSMGTAVDILGDYARTARPETLAEKMNNDSSIPTEDIARLKGVRLVNVSEPKKRLKLDEAKIKQFTGGDIVNARFLHENSFEFLPVWKWIVNTNHLPYVSDETLFTSGRIYVIPFLRHFKPEERDTTLKTLFAQPENKKGILNWFLEGYKLYAAEGFTNVPEAVKKATEEYKQESDLIAQFLAENFEQCIGNKIKTSTMHNIYIEWCQMNGYKPLSSRNFVPELKAKGLEISYNGKTGNYVTGLIPSKEVPNGFH